LKIVLIVEGETEKALLPALRQFLKARLPGGMPRIVTDRRHGRIPTGDKLKRTVERYLIEGADAVVALTDVYTGTREFTDAADAKNKMRQWVGPDKRFYPHAAQYDFEAWLLPFWDDIKRLSGTNRNAPAGNPESVNHMAPPANRLAEAFRTGTRKTYYNKPIHAAKILDGKDLAISAAKCRELRELLDTLATLGGGDPVFK
jgi:hypothetical protein